MDTGFTIPGYSISRTLGRGGMATVYQGKQISLDRDVAIKVMDPHLAREDETFGKRFLREALIAGKLKHPHIVQIFDFGEADDHLYMSMEMVTGGSLKDRIEERLDTVTALKVAGQIASALGYAHQQGFIHRDLKPDNILFRADGSAVLMDFGIARAVDSNTQMTKAGTVFGTPHYMSPEQAMGKADIDSATDMYSLGCLLFEMLTGRVPYNGKTALDICMSHVRDPIPKLPPFLAHLQPLIDQLMEKNPRNRIPSEAVAASIGDFQAEISQQFSQGQGQGGGKPGWDGNRTQVLTPDQMKTASRRRLKTRGMRALQQAVPTVWLAVGGAVAVVLAAGAWVLMNGGIG